MLSRFAAWVCAGALVACGSKTPAPKPQPTPRESPEPGTPVGAIDWVVTGTVVDSHNRPVDGAALEVVPLRPALVMPPIVGPKTDSRGVFRWHLRTRAFDAHTLVTFRAHAGHGRVGYGSRLFTPTAKLEPLRIIVHPVRRISGRVLDHAGAPIANAWVEVACFQIFDPGRDQSYKCVQPTQHVRTDASGRYSAIVPQRGLYRLFAFSGFAMAKGILAQVVDRDRSLDLRLPRTQTVALTITGAGDRPLGGAKLRRRCDRVAGVDLVSDARGMVSVRRAAGANGHNRALCVRAAGYVDAVVEPKQTAIRLVRAGMLRGSVTSRMIGLTWLLVACKSGACKRSKATAANHTVPLTGAGPFAQPLAPGRYEVSVHVAGAGSTASRSVEIVAGKPTRPQRFELGHRRAAVTGTLATKAGVPRPARVELSLSSEPSKQHNSRMVTTDAKGRFRIDGLTPGDYTFSWRYHDQTVTLKPGPNQVQLIHDDARKDPCPGCGGNDPSATKPAHMPFIAVEGTVVIGFGDTTRLAAGLLPGDVIERSDGKNGAAGLRGPKGSTVRLELLRPGTRKRIVVTARRDLRALD